MTAQEKQERRAMRHELQHKAKLAISLNARLGMTPAQVKEAARKMTDQAISRIVNGR